MLTDVCNDATSLAPHCGAHGNADTMAAAMAIAMAIYKHVNSGSDAPSYTCKHVPGQSHVLIRMPMHARTCAHARTHRCGCTRRARCLLYTSDAADDM
eukprot:10026364-Alexandrium_andersonii.AAC.1